MVHCVDMILLFFFRKIYKHNLLEEKVSIFCSDVLPWKVHIHPSENPGYIMCVMMIIFVAVRVGIPESPSQCSVQATTNTTAVVHCYPGYSGGQGVSYVVYKAGA